MATLFCNPGRVSVLEEPGCGLPITFSLDDGCWKGGTVFRAIITAVDINQQSGFQFMHTLRDKIFLYLFGERIGEMTISGVTFAGGCDVSGQNFAGIEAVISYYQARRATRRFVPLNINIGRVAIKAFLMGVNTGIVDMDTGLGRFAFKLYFPPNCASCQGIAIECPVTSNVTVASCQTCAEPPATPPTSSEPSLSVSGGPLLNPITNSLSVATQ